MNKEHIRYHYGVEQRSSEWFDLKCGRFSASEIYKLCGVRGLGQTGETYIFDKVAEILTGKVREIPTTFAMQHGIDTEPVVKAIYESNTGVEVKEPAFVTNKRFSRCGVSPDGIVEADNFIVLESYGIEIKCPESQSQYAKYLTIKTAEDLKRIKPEYYWQIQFCMLITEVKEWRFITYHSDFKNLSMIEIPVYWNTTDIDFLDERIKQANLMLDSKLEQIKNNWMKK